MPLKCRKFFLSVLNIIVTLKKKHKDKEKSYQFWCFQTKKSDPHQLNHENSPDHKHLCIVGLWEIKFYFNFIQEKKRGKCVMVRTWYRPMKLTWNGKTLRKNNKKKKKKKRKKNKMKKNYINLHGRKITKASLWLCFHKDNFV